MCELHLAILIPLIFNTHFFCVAVNCTHTTRTCLLGHMECYIYIENSLQFTYYVSASSCIQ